ncbi:MAG: hypothetical protein ACKOIZ_06880, partial [Actinomycetota bacterium]
ASFEIAPVSGPLDASIIKVGDEVTALGRVRRRFFRVGARTQSVTELVVEQIVAGVKPTRLDALFTLLAARGRETRSTELLKEGDSK